MIAASEAADLDAIRAELLAALTGQRGGVPGDGGDGEGAGGGGGSGGGWNTRGGSAAISERLERAEADRAVQRFRDELQASIRRALVADRGARAVSKTMRIRLARMWTFDTASAAEREAMVASIGPRRDQLSKILAQQEYRKRRLSVRRTLHLAMGTGGVPFRIATEPMPPPKPEIVVLCDVSGSVATFSRFTLNLLIALDSRLKPASCVLVRRRPVGNHRAGERGTLSRAGSSVRPRRRAVPSGGTAARTTATCCETSRGTTPGSSRVALWSSSSATRARITLIRQSGALAQVSDRVGKLYWLNPEPRRYWNQGDSVMSSYAPLCSQVRECSTLRQIADFVRSLTVGPAPAQ